METEMLKRFAKRLRVKLENYVKALTYRDLVVEVRSLEGIRVTVNFDESSAETISVSGRVQNWLISEKFAIGGLVKDELSATFSVSCSEQVVKDMLLLDRNH